MMNDAVWSYSCKSRSSGRLHHKPNSITPKYDEAEGAGPLAANRPHSTLAADLTQLWRNCGEQCEEVQ